MNSIRFIPLFLFAILGFIGFLVFLFIKYIIMEKKVIVGKNFFNFYLAFISFVSFIALTVSGGILINDTIRKTVISDKEYLQMNYRDYRQCNSKNSTNKEDKERNEKKEEECISKENQKLLDRRSIKYKETVIDGGTRFIIALIIFLTHYFAFRKARKEK